MLPSLPLDVPQSIKRDTVFARAAAGGTCAQMRRAGQLRININVPRSARRQRRRAAMVKRAGIIIGHSGAGAVKVNNTVVEHATRGASADSRLVVSDRAVH